METPWSLPRCSHHLLLNSPASSSYIHHKFPKLLLPSSMPNMNFSLLTGTSACSMEPSLSTETSRESQAARAFDNDSALTSSTMDRIGEVKRVTKETNVPVNVNLDGSGSAENSTGVPFLEHILDEASKHCFHHYLEDKLDQGLVHYSTIVWSCEACLVKGDSC